MSKINSEELKNIIGQKFGSFTVIELLPRKKLGRDTFIMVTCKCDCGNIKELKFGRIKNGHIKTCGCSRQNNKGIVKHGYKKDPAYSVWHGLKNRCTNKNEPFYKSYGGRGIIACKEWMDDAKKFIEWAYLNGYSKGLQLDRIDNNGNYEPSNCRFVTSKENARNRRSNIFIEHDGQIKLITEWAKHFGVNRTTLSRRLKRGIHFTEAIKMLILFLFPLSLLSQDKKWYKITGNEKVIMSMQFVAGASDGVNQTLVHHIHTFARIFPNADMNYWDPRLSQDRKHHTLTIFSDPFHITRTIEHTFNYASIAISTGDLFSYPKKDRWKVIAKKFILSYLANRIGFAAVYNGVFSDRIERQRAGLDGR